MAKLKIKYLIIVLLLVLLMPIKTMASEYQVIIEDDANLVSESDIKDIKDEMTKISEYGNVIFKTITENDTTPASYARNYYYSKFGDESGTIFLIDMQNRYLYIHSRGYIETKISNRDSEVITDNIYKLAKDGRYGDCAFEAFREINVLVTGHSVVSSMQIIGNIFISILISSFICFISAYKSNTVKKNMTRLEKDKSIFTSKFLINNIVGTKTGQIRRYEPQSDSSSGSSGGGGGGGGGGGSSSGGSGGGHGF